MYGAYLPKKPRRVLILGSGALQIGQAGEFDYSGSQAIKALKEEGIFTVLVNPNIATIQTSSELADRIYLVAVTPEFVERIIAKEDVDAILLSFGGQTALNCGLELARRRRPREVRRPGARARPSRPSAIPRIAACSSIACARSASRPRAAGPATRSARRAKPPPRSGCRSCCAAASRSAARAAASSRRRGSSTLALRRVFDGGARQVLVEECLRGWKEIEYEVVRDARDNCITVCNMENLDPMGIHTGESIVVAPSQTLERRGIPAPPDHRAQDDSPPRHRRRVQHPVRARSLDASTTASSRSTRACRARARSRARRRATRSPTSPPSSRSATRSPRSRTGSRGGRRPSSSPRSTTSCARFRAGTSPSSRAPRCEIGSEMKSVGEVMAIGRTFPEVIQKALRMLDIGVDGLDADAFGFDGNGAVSCDGRRRFGCSASPRRWRTACPSTRSTRLTGIDRWFLHAIATIVATAQGLARGAHADRCRPPARREIAGLLGSRHRATDGGGAGIGPGAPPLACDHAAPVADRHARRRVSGRDQLPLLHLQRVRARRPVLAAAQDHGARLGRLPDRLERRVRLVRRQRGQGRGGARLRDDHAQLQPRDGQHRLRRLRQAGVRRNQPRDRCSI